MEQNKKHYNIPRPENPMTPEELQRIKLPINYETYLYLCDAGYTINNYETMPEPLRSQFEEMEYKERERLQMAPWD